jgi:hypothetical protein
MKMKRTILALLMAVLLVITIPAVAMAAPAHPDCVVKPQTVSATMSVMAVGTSPDYAIVPFAKNLKKVTGTVYYQGVVNPGATPAVVAPGTPVMASEKVDYLLDQNGKVLFGMVQGNLVINPGSPDSATITFRSIVKGNILTGPASDQGRWDVVNATGALEVLKNADGDWSASVQKVDIAPGVSTFQGIATVNGKINNYNRDYGRR